MQLENKIPAFDMQEDFLNFTALGIDRLECLKRILNKYNIPFTQIELSGTNHIVVKFPKEIYSPGFTIKTFLAHYDCVSGSPGANDNASSVFLLLNITRKIFQNPGIYNTRVIFTGNEELFKGQGVKEQGAYALGLGLKALGCHNDDIYVLDCMGRGDTLILSDVGFYSAGNKKKSEKSRLVYQRAVEACRRVSSGKPGMGFLTLPVPYGDNAGLYAAGLSAQAVTVLPGEEAVKFWHLISKTKWKKIPVFSKELLEQNQDVMEAYPDTWKLINSVSDNVQTLNREAFDLSLSFIWDLVTMKYPVY